MQSRYEIVAQLKGINAVISDFKRVQDAALKSSRAMQEGVRAEQRTRREAMRQTEREDRAALQAARQREREATREALDAVRQAERAQRNMYRMREQLYREDLANHRRYITQLRKQQSELEDKRGKTRGQVMAGAIGLGLTAAGVRTAGSFEAAMTELKLSIAQAKDGAVDMQLLNEQMGELEKLAVRLGNRLPGTTEDFVRLFISLKQGGMATKDILGGAGEAIANLAVLTHSDPAVLGKQFAQIGQMFRLKPEEYGGAVEQFHALFRKGVDPSELIESAKFFAPRAGAPLGLTGIEGLSQSGLLLGAMNRAGLMGGIGGRNVAMMMSRMVMDTKPQQQALAELKSKGIDLQFFDKKGDFLGVENMVAQLEKLKGLSKEDRLRITGNLFTEEAATAASNIIDLGVEGLREYRAEVQSVIPTQQAITELQKNFNEKWEAMLGTGTNVVVRVFTPMMNTLKPIVEGVNDVLAALEGLAKTNPQIAQLLTSMAGIGSVMLLAKGSVSGLILSYRMYQLAARLAAAENLTLARSTTAVGTAAATTSTQVDTAAAKTSRWRRELTGIPAMIGTTIVLTLATEVIRYIIQLRDEAKQAWDEAKGTAQGEAVTTAKMFAAGHSIDKLKEMSQTGGTANLARFLGGFEDAAKSKMGWMEWINAENPYRGIPLNPFPWLLGDKGAGTDKYMTSVMRDQLPGLNQPSQFAFFMRAIRESNIPLAEKQKLEGAAGQAFPEALKKYSEALKWAAGDREAAERRLIEIDKMEAEALSQSNRLLSDGFIPAVQGATDRLNALGLTGKDGLPEGATGGKVGKTGAAIIHKGEYLVPGTRAEMARKILAAGDCQRDETVVPLSLITRKEKP